MTRISQPAAVLIDLDGTLVDSVPDLACSVDQLMVELKLPLRGLDAVSSWVGNGIDTLVHRALTNSMNGCADDDLYEMAISRYFDIYREINGTKSCLYDGVVDGLNYLKSINCAIGCVTNKGRAFTLPLLKHFSIDHYFEQIICGDDLAEKKPHPLPLLTAARHFNVDVADCWMIGDSVNDVTAARRAGFSMIAVSYGYNHGVDIRSHAPDAVIDSMADLDQLISSAAIN